ncbi:helix-turn-helix domain-containing protein [Barrientosiimonas marina]|uniref:RodZ domain-containing protein n=2 Tax=Lentibacillus kimchii TaxID=1542911 RepID=A0ABW2UQ80_9BACI
MAIGEKLREAREKQNMSLETMQETTKIQKRYLEAIENENFSILPGTFYARAFIKEYATAVGLDPNELLEEYNAEVPQTEEDNSAHYSQVHRSRKDNSPNKSTNVFSFIPTVIVVLLVIGIVFIVWFFLQESSTEDSTDSAQTQPQTENNEVVREQDDESGNEPADDDSSDAEEDNKANAESTDSQEESPDPALTVDEESTGNPPESTLTLEHASNKISVTIEATDDSWLEVDNGDGDVLFKDTATAEDSPIELDVSGADRVRFNVGNAPALDITVDGAALDYPVDPDNEVFHQKIWVNLNKEQDSGK